MAQPLATLTNGRPVRPSWLTIVSAPPAAAEPPKANSTSLHSMPGVGEGLAHGEGALLQAGRVVPAERVDADPDDGDVIHQLALLRRARTRT